VATFIDKFFSSRVRVPDNVGERSQTYQQLWKAMGQAECIVAHNVSEYYFTSDTEYWEFPTDFPAVVPPFRTCLVECGRPSRVRSKARGESPEMRDKLPKSWGVLFQTLKLTEFLAQGPDLSAEKYGWRHYELRKHLEMLVGDDPAVRDTDVHDGEAWVKIAVKIHDKSPMRKEAEQDQVFNIGELWFITATLFAELPNGIIGPSTDPNDGIIGPIGTYSFLVDKYGYVLGEPLFSIPTVNDWVRRLGGTTDVQTRETERILRVIQANTSSTLFFPAFLAVAFMHCKNVTMKTERPPKKLNHSRVKKGRRALITYRMLEIEPMKKVLRSEGNAEETGIKQALHITRGHFKDYRNSEKGLFGRYKGLWWWDQHVAGKAEHGTVVKDYVELAPGEDENPLEEK
jgi:hypothetical protein